MRVIDRDPTPHNLHVDLHTELRMVGPYPFFLPKTMPLFIRDVPGIVLPLTPMPSGPLDELYPSAENSCAISIHIVLIVIQGVDILSSPLSPFFIVAAFIAYSGTILIIVYAICFLSNKGVSGEFVFSDEHLLEGYEKRDSAWLLFSLSASFPSASITYEMNL
ncbi:hypothetical protein SCP_0600810 [Sparassis crispa]|uniref:Uncharacterized protein n=1 Tax=Sparassis crispa TaxID=139825 RepID=A0A401GPF6_9APHY|nr:hypothetical protein SCP_0600810 [Sparassis crispa]GBE84103.1 hypothetical protein SCP_0600810 [Sparassis crispa]